MAFLTDAVLLNEIQYDLIEAPDSGATFPSGLWTAAEVLADHREVVQQVTDGDRLSALPWLFTEDGDNIIDNDNDGQSGSLFNYAVVGGLMGDDLDLEYKADTSSNFSSPFSRIVASCGTFL